MNRFLHDSEIESTVDNVFAFLLNQYLHLILHVFAFISILYFISVQYHEYKQEVQKYKRIELPMDELIAQGNDNKYARSIKIGFRFLKKITCKFYLYMFFLLSVAYLMFHHHSFTRSEIVKWNLHYKENLNNLVINPLVDEFQFPRKEVMKLINNTSFGSLNKLTERLARLSIDFLYKKQRISIEVFSELFEKIIEPVIHESSNALTYIIPLIQNKDSTFHAYMQKILMENVGSMVVKSWFGSTRIKHQETLIDMERKIAIYKTNLVYFGKKLVDIYAINYYYKFVAVFGTPFLVVFIIQFIKSAMIRRTCANIDHMNKITLAKLKKYIHDKNLLKE
jgi:hypothetical protein